MFVSRNLQRLQAFPPVNEANDEGLLAIGGDLSTDRLLLAYRSGIFPWFEEGLPVLWWSPDPRAILELDRLHVSRRLRRTIRQNRFRSTVNQAFEQVMRGCAEAREDGTWITQSMIDAYCELHRVGHAHSVETWHGDQLVGGIYGVAIGGFFAGESMFYRCRDASKVALVQLVERLRECDFCLFDLQILNDHTKLFGASEISRDVYLKRLAEAITRPIRFQ